jgi:hypothetical protein
MFLFILYIFTNIQWKKQQLIGSFWEKKFFPRFDEKMKYKMAAMRSLIMQNAKKIASP